MIKVLFVCWGNMDRGPTAEDLLRTVPGFQVLSAGTFMLSRRRLSAELIDWADRIFVMENSQYEAVLALRPTAGGKTTILNIPNIYRRNDPALVMILEMKLSEYLNVRI